MKLNVDDVQSAINRLNDARSELALPFTLATGLTAGTFSQVSGLDKSGSMHGTIRSDSEPEATKGLAQHFNNAVDLLSAQLLGYQMADMSFADVLGSMGQSVMGNSYQAVIDDVSTEHPVINTFDATRPVAGKPMSLDSLNMQLIATDVASMSGMSADWADTAATVGEALSFIPGAIADLQGSAETESISKAIENLGQIQTAGTEYAANASALSAHTASLVTVTEANALQVAAALAVARSTPSPGVAKALEESFLAAFSPKLTTELVPVTPLFTQLLPELGAPNGAGTNQSGHLAPNAPGFEDTPLPKIVQQALSNAGYRDLAYASTPTQVIEQFGRPNPDMLQSIAAGATPTQAASAAAPTMPPSLTGITGGGAAGTGGALPGGAGVNGIGPTTGLAGVGGVAGGAGGAGAGNLNGLAGPAMGTLGGGRGGAGAAGGFGGMRGGAASGGVGGAMGAGRLGGAGFGGGAGVGFGGPGGGFAGSATGGHGGGAFVGTGASGGGSAGAGARGAIAGGPGMYGAGQRGAGAANRKRGKVQAVTSSVEREGNLKALLGEAPEVVPGVIGAWVRQPKH